MTTRHVLILGGTCEAAALAGRLHAADDYHPVSSLAGRTGNPRPLPGEVRIGGFGGVEGLAEFLSSRRIDMVIDATHPFAATMSRNAAAACDRIGLPRLRLERPPWVQQANDRWIEAEDVHAAARALPSDARRVFLSIGRQELAPFAARPEIHYLVRMIEPATKPPPLPRHELVLGRGPFHAEAEQGLLVRHRIEFVVSKNSGGDATYAKILAARHLGLPVIMIKRPEPPVGPCVETVEAALGWLRRHRT